MKRLLITVSDSPYSLPVVVLVAIVGLVIGLVGLGRASAVSELEADLTAAQSEIETLQGQVDDMGDGITQILGLAFELQSSLGSLGPEVRGELETAAAELVAFRDSTLTFEVAVSERIPVSADIPLQRTLQVPIDTTLPIDETVNTTITVDGPFGLDIPVGVTVPIQLDFPIQLSVPIPIDETVSVATDVVLDLSVPIAIAVADTELVRLVDGLQAMVDAVLGVVDSLEALDG